MKRKTPEGRKVGRPAIGSRAMTATERKRRERAIKAGRKPDVV